MHYKIFPKQRKNNQILTLANRRKMKNIYIILKYFIPGDLAR